MNYQATPQYLNTENAAMFCGISKKTLEKYRRYGIGPQYIQRGRKLIRYRPEDLQARMDEGRQPTIEQDRP